jgi:hypothetical protein
MLQGLIAQSSAESATISTLLFVVLLAFVLATMLAYVYQKTFRGLSYSRNFVQSIVLISILASMVIQSVGDSLARGIGIMAAMAIIRFRTNFKDPRDTLCLFAGLATSIFCGAVAFGVALVGTFTFAAVTLLLHYSPLGPNAYFDGMLRFNMSADTDERVRLESMLNAFGKTCALITLRGHRKDNRAKRTGLRSTVGWWGTRRDSLVGERQA